MTAPVDFAAVQKALYTWFKNSTGLPVVWAFQKRPQKDREAGFGVLQILSVGMPPSLEVDEERTIGTAATIPASIEISRSWVGTRRIVVNCQVVTNSQDFECSAFNALSSAQAQLRGSVDLETGALTYVFESPITNLSAVAGEGYESRASMDVTFDVQSVFTEATPSGWFNQAVINGKQIGPP